MADLPAGWTHVALDPSLIQMKSGFACARSRSVAHGLPHLRPFNVDLKGNIDLSELIYIPENFVSNSHEYHLKKGDVLFNNTNSVELVGKSALAKEPMVCAFSNHITRLRVIDTEHLDPNWLLIFLRQKWADGYFAANCNRWIGQAGFSASKLTELEIPLPPLETQRRIVQRLEALLAEVADARQLQGRIVDDTGKVLTTILLETYKQLKQSFSGKALGDGTLAQILAGQHIMSRYYSDQPIGTPYITGPADFGDKYPAITKWTTRPLVVSKPGDVLFTVKGSGVGKVNCAPLEHSTCISRQIMAIRPNQQELDTDYLYYALLGRFEEFQDLRQGAAIPGIRKEQVEVIEIPLPPLSKQKQVVNYISATAAELSEMNNVQRENAELIKQLEQSFLAQAFRGEL